MLCLPLLIVILLASLAQSQMQWPAVQGALRGMGLVAAGLLLGSCWKLAQPLRQSRLGAPRAFALAAVAALLVGVVRLPLLPVLIVVGGAGMALAYQRPE
jgi:chromate transporter